jgi:hypothetical protein
VPRNEFRGEKTQQKTGWSREGALISKKSGPVATEVTVMVANKRSAPHIFRKIPLMKGEIQPRRFIAFNVKCTKLLNECNET